MIPDRERFTACQFGPEASDVPFGFAFLRKISVLWMRDHQRSKVQTVFEEHYLELLAFVVSFHFRPNGDPIEFEKFARLFLNF